MTCLRVCVPACLCACVPVCVRACVCLCACVSVCVLQGLVPEEFLRTCLEERFPNPNVSSDIQRLPVWL